MPVVSRALGRKIMALVSDNTPCPLCAGTDRHLGGWPCTKIYQLPWGNIITGNEFTVMRYKSIGIDLVEYKKE